MHDRFFPKGLDNFKSLMEEVKQMVEKADPGFVFQRRAAASTVPMLPLANETVEVFLNPWHLSFDPAMSLKGKSKMVHVLRCVNDFLEKPYNSVENPIHVFFPKSMCSEGDGLEPFSVGHGIGFAKSLAIKAILLGVYEIKNELSDPEFRALIPSIKPLFGFRCTYKTAGDERTDRFQCLQDKFSEAARPRPDCIQVANLLLAQARADGMQWDEACKVLIPMFNQGSQSEVKQLTDMEVCIVKALPTLDEDTFSAIDYHWQQTLIKNSALPYKVLGNDFFFNGSKPRQDNELWRCILAPDNRKRHWFVKRKILYFQFRVADAKRLKKKVNLTTASSSFRDKLENDAAWAVAAIFSHFLQQWEGLLAKSGMIRLQEKFCRGYLDTELQEKYRMLNPTLAPSSFRFLTEVGYQAGLLRKLIRQFLF